MSMRATDRLIGNARGHPDEAIAYAERHGAKRLADVVQYVHFVYAHAQDLGLDPAIIIAQSAHEADAWRSSWWVNRLNVAGIGITGDPKQDAASGRWLNGEEAAKAQLYHLGLYVGVDYVPWSPYDPRRLDVIKAGYFGVAETIDDLTATWAEDAVESDDPLTYAEKIAARGNTVFPDIQNQEMHMGDITFGRVPHPPFVDKLVWANTAWNDLGPRRIVGVCQHSMVGSLAGSYTWINGGGGSASALWDYSVGGATDGDNDGVIWRHNDPHGRRAGWANGGSDGLEGDGPLFVRTLGINAINRDLVSIERSDGGNIQTPMSPRQFESICRLTAYWFDQAKVPWDRFPLNPAYEIVTHFLHYEFATKACPFPPVMNRIDDIQARVRAILKAAQGGDGDVVPPEPDHELLPPGIDWAIVAERFGVGELLRVGKRPNHFRFHRGRAWAEAWLARALNGQTWPAALVWNQYQDAPEITRETIAFVNGWLLVRLNSREGWRWA